MQLNVNKTKELCIDFVRDGTYKYLGIVIDSKLKWNENTEAMMKNNVNSRMFGVSADLLLMFYNAVISSTISFGAACWGGNVSQHDQGRVDKIIHRASRIVGRHLDNFQSLYQGKVLHKASQILHDSSHPSMSNFIHGSVTEAAYFYSLPSRQTATSILFYHLSFQFSTLN